MMKLNRDTILICTLFLLNLSGCQSKEGFEEEVQNVLRDQELSQAAEALQEEPVTVTAFISPRSEGSPHDFYSEGDYWWPDPDDPEGPYIRRDGMTNPDNFVAHRKAMIRFSRIIGSLASAYVITREEKYVDHAFRHLKAWFVDTTTMMNPSLLYAQAIKGRVSGRGIGIIDTIHLMEVAQGILAMENANFVDKDLLAAVKNWFAQYLEWLMTHPYSQDEMEAENNHGTCWVMQVASFAKLTDNQKLMDFCRERYKIVLLPSQMAVDGSFPLELERTKPYGYSLFNLDAMATVCQILSTPTNNLWEYETPEGKSIRKGIAFMFPYVKDKASWAYEPDVMYWEDWPVAHPFLVFGAEAFDKREWFATWKSLEHAPEVEEVVRNLPVRNPMIWLTKR